MTRDEQIAEAKRLHAAGLSIRRIERALGGPGRMTMWRWVNGARDGSGARAPRSSKGRFMKIPEVEGDGPIYPDIDPGDKDESTPIPLTTFTPPSDGLRHPANWPLRTRPGSGRPAPSGSSRGCI